MQEYYLVHHGVKGMKWGIRKDRSSSGSSKVKKAIKSGATKAVSVAKGKIADKREVSRANRLVKMASKDPSKLTESEMEYVNRRIKLENQVRANVESSKSDSKRPRNQREANREAKRAAKNSGVLSEKELSDRISRLQKEKQLRELTSDTISPGRTAAKKAIADGGSKALSVVANKSTTYAINKVLKSAGFPGVDFIAKVDIKKEKQPMSAKQMNDLVEGVMKDSSKYTKEQIDSAKEYVKARQDFEESIRKTERDYSSKNEEDRNRKGLPKPR